ncbi:hypothetical protein CWI36_0350p0010 [Hamiltosporidium magnivora]|uniref:Uncharacterized protein n=1 Tax=Hamiltosporidium magnivora TaxID=148818 RepID=A0A4Q9LGU5_9MICR|nr:hypothetical protein CWI36_0350p0010 [Hamiltosporidium magnivora]
MWFLDLICGSDDQRTPFQYENKFEKRKYNISGNNIKAKRKKEFKDMRNLKRIRHSDEVVFRNIENYKLKFNILSSYCFDSENKILIDVYKFDFTDFIIFKNLMDSLYLPFKKFTLHDFFLILNIFEYLGFEDNNQFEEIIYCLICNLLPALECHKKILEEQILKIKKQLILPIKFTEIILNQINKIFFFQNLDDEYFIEDKKLRLFTKEFNIAYLDNNTLFLTHPDINSSLYEEYSLNSSLYEEYCINSIVFSNIHYILLKMLNVEKYGFFTKNVNYQLINSSVKSFIDNIYELLFYHFQISDETFKLLNENSVFKALKHIYLINSTIETENRYFFKKNIYLEKINIKNVILYSNFEEKLKKLIYLDGLKSDLNGKYFILKENTVLDDEEYFVFKDDISYIHIYFNEKITVQILVFIASMRNLKTIKIDCHSFTNHQELSTDLFYCKEINELQIIRYDTILIVLNINFCKLKPIDTDYLFAENYTILEFYIYGNDFADLNILSRILYSLKKVESLFLHGDGYYSILYLKNINNFFSTRLFKKLSIISENHEEPFKEFEFLVNNTEQLYFGRNYPEGSLKNIFLKANLNKLKILSIHDFHIGKRDTNAFKDLDFLISLNILGCNFLDITLAGLFSDEKEYMIENLILRGTYLAEKDI